ncbi:MAG: YihY/virulence factor BrkB family protein, partial [Actinobacteria bacterium]|nr:YihY/virulence factor BrkB family protein [Actinomycetota bacterium]
MANGTELWRDWQALRSYASARGARGVAREIAAESSGNNLLTYASAISYQLLFALIPALLAAVALLGYLDLVSVWEEDVAPRLREQLSPAGFEVVSQTVLQVLGARRGYWMTIGLVFALWQLSGAVRATMGALNEIYGGADERPLLRRLAISLALAVNFATGVVGAVVLVQVTRLCWVG